MQLTRFTDLGLRAMMLLAAGESRDQRITTRRIAVATGASEHHIAKAVSKLVELGLVNARRGRVGGLELTDAGGHVSIGWLVRELEGDREVIDREPDNPCPLVRPASCAARWPRPRRRSTPNSTSTPSWTWLEPGRLSTVLSITTERNPS
jgi:Rrf2 family nitric oxide-sensitive transcriptional repressor